MERCPLGDAGDAVGGSAGDGGDAGDALMSIARLMILAVAWVALVAASLRTVRRCDARFVLAVAVASVLQWHRRCASLGLALAMQAVTWAAAQSATMWAAAQVAWRSGARWLTLETPLLVTPRELHVHVACL